MDAAGPRAQAGLCWGPERRQEDRPRRGLGAAEGGAPTGGAGASGGPRSACVQSHAELFRGLGKHQPWEPAGRTVGPPDTASQRCTGWW